MPERDDDEPSSDAEILFSTTQSTQRSFDRLHKCESLHDVQNGRVPHLDVADAIFSGVFRQLIGNSLERFLRLHYRNGYIEPLQVILQSLRVVHSHELG